MQANQMIYLYYLLMLTCFIFCIFFIEFAKVKLVAGLLLGSIFSETLVEILIKSKQDFFIVYHFFILIEYALVTLILALSMNKKKLQTVMVFSIPVFWLLSLFCSLALENFHQYPSLNSNVEGLLILIWCMLAFLSIEPREEITIFRQESFWITLAFFSYFTGTICINSIYNTLRSHHSETAEMLYTIINSIFNYLLYIFLTIGIFCFRWKKKSSVQS